jgi:hypothetical protein
MKAALIDNGSLEPDAHRNLRRIAALVGELAGIAVDAVSWKHSDRIPETALGGRKALTLEAWVRDEVAGGEREFVFIPFFVCPQGAVGSCLRGDLEALALETGMEFTFTAGLSSDLASIAAERAFETVTSLGLDRPAVILVDHGGPAAASAGVRNAVSNGMREVLGKSIGPLSAASMESPDGPEFQFNRPLFSELLSSPAFAARDTVVVPLFLAPGRHAGPGGDLERIARAWEARRPGLRCHFTGLVGTHPRVPGILALPLRAATRISNLQLETP